MMGEIDTKPIEPVQNAIYLFGDKGSDQKKNQPTRKNKRACEKEIEDLRKELANCKVQLEAKHAAHMQALLKLEQNHKMIHELSTLLKKCDLERTKYMDECTELGRARKDMIESKIKEIEEKNMESVKVRDQLSHVLSELKATQREILTKETELVAARDSELKALSDLEELKKEFEIQKVQKEELMNQVKELNEVIHRPKLDAIESEKDEKIELLTKDAAKAQQEIEDLRKQIEMLQGFKSQPTVKSAQFDDSASSDMKVTDQSSHFETLELELNQLKQELMRAKEETNELNITVESLEGELQKAKLELNVNKDRDIEAQVEITLLKSQLQEHRLFYINGFTSGNVEASQSGGAEEITNDNNKNDQITISLQDYKYLVRESEKVNEVQGWSQLASMKKELQNASAKIAELRARAEQALSRAELAEKAKSALEDKIARHREHRQRKKDAIFALKEESTPRTISPSSSNGTPRMQQPLGKVLNLKL